LAASCSSLLDQNAAQLFVVGGSALGPPTDLTTAAPIPPGERVFNAPSKGWSDVGIRLAFDAQGATLKPPSLAKIIRDQIAGFAYGVAQAPSP
ncbi:MAG: hypothetical protein AB7G11_10275, partial [Phycisphaerales bacterium]